LGRLRRFVRTLRLCRWLVATVLRASPRLGTLRGLRSLGILRIGFTATGPFAPGITLLRVTLLPLAVGHAAARVRGLVAGRLARRAITRPRLLGSLLGSLAASRSPLLWRRITVGRSLLSPMVENPLECLAIVRAVGGHGLVRCRPPITSVHTVFFSLATGTGAAVFPVGAIATAVMAAFFAPLSRLRLVSAAAVLAGTIRGSGLGALFRLRARSRLGARCHRLPAAMSG